MSLAVASNVAAIVLTPIALAGVHGMLTMAENGGIQFIPAGLVTRELLFMMLLPLGIGAAVRAGRPAWVGRHQQRLRKIAMLATIILLVLVIGTGTGEVVRYIQDIALITFFSTGVLFLVGWLIGLGFRLRMAEGWDVSCELPCRNLAITAIIGISVLNRPEVVRFSAALFVVQAAMMLMLVAIAGKLREGRDAIIG